MEYREYSKPHTLWIRDDLWSALKMRAAKEGKRVKGKITHKEQVEEALFNYLLRDEIEERTGKPTTFKETKFDPTENMTKRIEEL